MGKFQGSDLLDKRGGNRAFFPRGGCFPEGGRTKKRGGLKSHHKLIMD